MFALVQHILPKRLLSRFIGVFAVVRWPLLKNILIRSFIHSYAVDMSTSKRKTPEEFETFADFFSRELKPDLRPIPSDSKTITSPVDGVVSQSGIIQRGKLLQAKGHTYSVAELIGQNCTDLDGGSFLTLYLDPSMYHRVHAPIDAILSKTIEIPGKLFSVNGQSVHGIPNLFCRNERLVCSLQTDTGVVRLVMVGALIVASITTSWPGPRSPYRRRVERLPHDVQFSRAEEMARFTLGSTAIVLIPPSFGVLDSFEPDSPIKMGEHIGFKHDRTERP